MPLQIIKQDITKIACDILVNPTDKNYSGSGGTDYAIHKGAGAAMDAACRHLHPLAPGEVSFTPGYNLFCKYVIHTVGPVWRRGKHNEPALLRSCYVNSLMLAVQLGARSVAFPLISSGSFGFPKDMVMTIATKAISDFLYVNDLDLEVFLCVFDKKSFELSERLDLESFINSSKNFDFERSYGASYSMPSPMQSESRPQMNCPAAPVQPNYGLSFDRSESAESENFDYSIAEEKNLCESAVLEDSKTIAMSEMDLSSWIKKHDDTFAVTLLKLIDKKGMTDVQCYKKANVSRKTFSKINNDANYRPSKQTVIAFAIALELSLEETEQLLRTVGFSLSHSNTFDLIIEFFIVKGVYDIFEINAALYQYDQVCLG